MTIKRKHSVCSLKDSLDALARSHKDELTMKLVTQFGIGKAIFEVQITRPILS